MIKKKKQEIEQGMKSVRGRETSQISMIKVRGSGREREGAGGSEKEWEGVGRSGKEWEGVGGSGREEKLLKQKVVLDFFWKRTLYCALTG